jgi:hypothetical protein
MHDHSILFGAEQMCYSNVVRHELAGDAETVSYGALRCDSIHKFATLCTAGHQHG